MATIDVTCRNCSNAGEVEVDEEGLFLYNCPSCKKSSKGEYTETTDSIAWRWSKPTRN